MCLFALLFAAASAGPGHAQDSQPDLLITQDDIDIMSPSADGGASPEAEVADDVVPELKLEPLPGISQSEMEEMRNSLGSDDQLDAAGAADAPAKPTFRVGIVPRGDRDRFLRRLRPLETGLSELLGRPVDVLPMATYSSMINAHTLRQIDIGFYSASAFVTADKLCRCVEPIVAPAATDGTASYYAVIVARQGGGIGKVADLRGKAVAAGSEDSIAGYRVQLASLVSEGIDFSTYFSRIEMAGSAVGALRLLRNGQVDAAFAWSSMNGDQSAGYSRGPLAYLVGRGELDMSDIAIIWQSKPIAHAPVVGAKSLIAAEREAVKTYLLALSESDTATYDLLDPYFGGGYRPADTADFRGIGILSEIELRRPRSADPLSAGATNTVESPVSRLRPGVGNGVENGAAEEQGATAQ
jgi:phosphonate transport system substrate-binding protein